jgi:hypothetical protein
VETLVVAVLKAAGTAGGFALLVYVLGRVVSAAKKAGRTGTAGQIVGVFLTMFPGVIVPVPPPDVPTETRKVKRNQGESGDPP